MIRYDTYLIPGEMLVPGSSVSPWCRIYLISSPDRVTVVWRIGGISQKPIDLEERRKKKKKGERRKKKEDRRKRKEERRRREGRRRKKEKEESPHKASDNGSSGS